MTLKAAIIGTGQIASTIDNDAWREDVWSHAAAFKKCLQTDLTAACDIDEEKLKAFGSEWNVVNLYTDYNEMLSNQSIDIVSICTPTATHHFIIKDIVKYNIKAVFCEKPLAFSYRDCVNINSLCKRANIILAVNYFRRWDNLYLKTKEIIETKTLGTLISIVLNGNTALFMNASHMIDLLLMLCGKLDKVMGRLGIEYIRMVHGEADPGGTFHFSTSEGVEGLLCAERDSSRKYHFEIDLGFTKGRLRIVEDASGRKRVEFFGYEANAKESGYFELVQKEFPVYPKNQRLVDAVENIANAIKTKKSNIYCSGEDASESVRVIEAFYETAKTKSVVTL